MYYTTARTPLRRPGCCQGCVTNLLAHVYSAVPAAKRVNDDSDQVQRLARDLLSELAPGRLLLETTIELGAHRLTALIDTGALSSHVSVRVSDKIELESIALPTPIVTVDASGSTHTVHAAPVARFSFVTGENLLGQVLTIPA